MNCNTTSGTPTHVLYASETALRLVVEIGSLQVFKPDSLGGGFTSEELDEVRGEGRIYVASGTEASANGAPPMTVLTAVRRTNAALSSIPGTHLDQLIIWQRYTAGQLTALEVPERVLRRDRLALTRVAAAWSVPATAAFFYCSI